MSYDPDRPRPGTDGEADLDALLGSSPPAEVGAADHRAESAQRAVPSPAAPLDVDIRLIAAAVVAALVVLWLVVRSVRGD